MPLGPEHVQAAESDDLLFLGIGLDREAQDGGLERLVVAVVTLGEILSPHLGLRHRLGIASEHDVDAASGHVRRNRDRPELARLGDDVRLPLVLLGVEDLVRDPASLQDPGQPLRLLDRNGSDEDGLARRVPFFDVVGEGGELVILVDVDEIRFVRSRDRLVRWNLDHVEPVDLVELPGLGQRGPRHAGELLVHAEVVLECDGGESLVFFLDLDALFGLDRLVQTLRVATTIEDPPGELVDDLDLAVANQVVHVALVQLLRLQGDIQLMDQIDVGEVIHVFDTKDLLDAADTVLRRHHLALRLVHLVVLVAAQPLHDAGEVAVPLARLAHPAADDQRGAGFVDEDRVHFVDDAVGMPSLNEVFGPHRHVVAEVVESDLVVGAVRDVRGVRRTALSREHVGLDESHRHPEEPVDLAHPCRIARGEVVVDGHQVDPAAGQGVQVRGHRRDEGLALAGLHLRDHPAKKRPGSDDLHIEMALPEGAPRGFPNACEGLGLDLIERCAIGHLLPELAGPGSQLVVAEQLGRRFERIDSLDETLELLQPLALADAKDLAEDGHCSWILRRRGGFQNPVWLRQSRAISPSRTA